MGVSVVVDLKHGNATPTDPSIAHSMPSTARLTRPLFKKPPLEASRAWEYLELHMLRKEVSDLRLQFQEEETQRSKTYVVFVALLVLCLGLTATGLYFGTRK